jgi:glycosyltransferase involved in cell wall biosynthesis
MRITLCVDALASQLSGIGRYTWKLCEGLAEGDEISSLRFYRENLLIGDPGELLRAAHSRRKRDRAVDRWFRRLQARRALRTSLVHGPNYFLPPEAESGVITVHDLSVFRHPETHPADRLKAFERRFESSLSRAAHVITDSETVRQELVNSFSIPAASISAIPLGVEARFRPHDPGEVSASIAQWGLTAGNYGLSVAAFQPRKKISELIHAWRRLPSRIRDDFPLVLAGAAGWRNEELHEQIVDATSQGWLRHLGFVDETHLPQLYAGASLFLYPSIYEGFGLPPIEAMASGTPVIVSNRSCLPEVCGDGARFIDPDDGQAFTCAIEEGLFDQQWRSQTIAKGLERARRFTWDRCIADTVSVYRKI